MQPKWDKENKENLLIWFSFRLHLGQMELQTDMQREEIW